MPMGLPQLEEEGGIDDGLGGLKTHRCVHLVLALLKRGKSLTHLLV
jgi:hypothetical protein